MSKHKKITYKSQRQKKRQTEVLMTLFCLGFLCSPIFAANLNTKTQAVAAAMGGSALSAVGLMSAYNKYQQLYKKTR